MNNSNKQAKIQIFDTKYCKIGSMYRPMMRDDLLVDRIERSRDYNKGFNGLLNKIFNPIESMSRLELPESTSENSFMLNNRELCHYASGIVRCLENPIIITACKSKPGDAMKELVEATKRVGADAIEVDVDRIFRNKYGYSLVGSLYVKR